jgi:cytochrome c oxidase cbb3-type subunit 1
VDWHVKAFIRASLAWFTLGILLGIGMAAYPPWVVYRPAHAHLNVVGFLTLMLFGVGYQLLPRLFGHQLRSRTLAVTHWWLANGGLAVMITGFLVAPHASRASIPVTATGGTLFGIGALLFVLNLWRTFDAAEARHRSRQTGPSSRSLPTAD